MMKMKHWIVLHLILQIGVGSSAQDSSQSEFRYWSTADGRRSSVRLKVVDSVDNIVRLEREDTGRVIELARDHLSEADLRYLDQPERSSAPTASSSSHWSRFRGPGGGGVSSETGLPTQWSDSTNMVWKRPLPGFGASSPVTFGDRIFLTCYSGYGLSEQPAGNKGQLTHHLLCLNRSDGSVVWEEKTKSTGDVADYSQFMALHGYASSTPVVDSSGVYVFYGTTGLHAFSLDGSLHWKKDCGSRAHGWGSGSSPVLHDGRVYVHADVESTTMFALDTVSGNEVWKKTYQRSGQDTRATPLIATLGGREQLLFHSTMGTFTSLDPATGQQLWQYQGTKNYQNPSPITDGKSVFVLTYGQTLALNSNGEEQWENKKGTEICTPIYHDGHLYFAHQENGIAHCLNAETGEVVYQERLRPAPGKLYASGVMAEGKIYYVSRETGTFVVVAEPRFEQLAHNVIESDGSVFNATPAISSGQLLVRSDKFLYCIGSETR